MAECLDCGRTDGGCDRSYDVHPEPSESSGLAPSGSTSKRTAEHLNVPLVDADGRKLEAAGNHHQGQITEAMVDGAASAIAAHVTGYSMRDGGYTYTCRCGWSHAGDDAQAEAQKHRARAALEAAEETRRG